MQVRIRLRRGSRVKRKARKNQRVALAAAALLKPAALMACVLGLWRLAADAGAAGQFAIPTGLFSHWQVWVGGAAALELLSVLLNWYGDRDEPPTLLNSGF
jgi:hypothetical protein